MAAARLKTIWVALRAIRFAPVAQACGGVGLRLAPPEPEAALEQVPPRGQPLLIVLQVDPVELPTAHL